MAQHTKSPLIAATSDMTDLVKTGTGTVDAIVSNATTHIVLAPVQDADDAGPFCPVCGSLSCNHGAA
ncbi:hypothetical protein FHW79_005360 [Azospirillum sp. OGB3]|uniref:hypothetical protein n=1 Tax=Azospirillum sp. OGB3 TaxID=2587012 RepID=UPI001605FA2B|nr:hypothetical protein [Azospirillum sp. OGB3]MBB3267695.1 hypothetical protein [Azospirillum sp. OGB3]